MWKLLLLILFASRNYNTQSLMYSMNRLNDEENE